MACVIGEVLDVKRFFCERILSCLTQWFFPERLVLYFLSIEFCRHFFVAFLEADNSGRFLKYDPLTRKTTVLIDGLQFPNGVRVSKDGTFVVFAETRGSRCVLLA